MPSLHDLLLIEPLPQPIEDHLQKHFTLHRFSSLEALLPVAHKIRAVATGGSYGLASDVMAALPQLEMIAVNGVGLDRIDLNETKRRHIQVSVTTDISTSDVADTAMMLLLALKRQLSYNEAFLRRGEWTPQQTPPLAHSLCSQKMGIAGFGRIGQAIARRAHASDMEIAYFSGHQHPDSTFLYMSDLTQLARWADILVIALPATAQTTHLISSSILRALGPQGVLINIARGAIIDEPALISALKEHSIAGAGLDVFQNEPYINPDFFTLPNTVLQPHQASATIETRLKMGQNVIDNLLAHFSGRPLLTPAY